ncbi:hypothetical protein C0992_007228, partial [Termitomyces sp. T32_za158]
SPLFNPSHPGGLYNPPRKGTAKRGLFPISVDQRIQVVRARTLPVHMQYYHGISAATQRPYAPPRAFRLTPRPNHAKHERTAIREALCHKCARWVPLEGIKDVQPKVRHVSVEVPALTLRQVKDIFWYHPPRFTPHTDLSPHRWKHAAACHGASSRDDDVFEHDSVYAVLSKL